MIWGRDVIAKTGKREKRRILLISGKLHNLKEVFVLGGAVFRWLEVFT